jgi:Ser/Thr protein kinase RdoA (MazF antagonist)
MNAFFPATYSTLSATALADFIATQYGFPNVQCELLLRGVGDTYLVTTNDTRYIWRVYRSTHRTLSEVITEVEVLLACKEHGVSVSYPIADANGKVIQALNAVEGERYAVLFSYAPGKSERVLNETQVKLLGREMALFHNVSSTFEPGRFSFNTETTLDIPLRRLEKYFATLPEEYAWLQQAATQVKHKLENIDTTGFSYGYCQYDFLPKNFHYDGDKITLFDFDFMGYGWLVNDLSSHWQHQRIEIYTGRMKKEDADLSFANLVAAYREHRPISDEELALVPYLSLSFWLFYLGFHTTHDQFYSAIQPGTLKVYSAFLKDLAERYW